MYGTEQSFKDFVANNLNPSQQEAVTPESGALLVIAGAGSGKTRVITARITNLILEKGAHPHSIVALTFTNKAAGEMRERIFKFLGTQKEMPFVGTFHAYCLQLLRTNPQLLPFPHFSILDADDQQSIIKNLIKKFNLEKQVNASQLGFQISSMKNSTDETSFTQPLLKEIFHAYEAEKAAAHAFDFDDLILNVLRLLKTNKPFRDSLQSRIRHVLVDEYQDTSTVQHDLLKNLVLNSDSKVAIESVCAVGDEDQSIYSWRGANVTNMIKFREDFKPVSLIKIEQNYRSANNILQAANSVISNNKLRNPKNLWSEKKGTNRILHLQCRSGDQEAEAIAHALKNLPEGTSLGEVALLYRTHYQSRSLEEALIYHGIPYKIVGGLRFYERKEIKDLLAYLRLLVNPYDRLSFMRILNTPTRGLGKKCETEILSAYNRYPFADFKELLRQLPLDKSADLSAAHLNGLNKFVDLFDGIDAIDVPSNILNTVLERTDYEDFLKTTLDAKEADDKLQNINELSRAIEAFEKNIQHDKASFESLTGEKSSSTLLELFLHDVALLQERNDKDQTDKQAQLMTLHAAKGLEFELVIITGLDDGILPSTKSLNSNAELEEERRLFYVGITRAKEFLLLLSAHTRNVYGYFADQVRSRFVHEIKQEFVKSIDIDRSPAWQVSQIISEWLLKKAIAAPVPTLTTYAKSKKQAPITSSTPSSTPSFTAAKKTENTPWCKNQRVMHKQFGQGIVMEVEKISANEYYISAVFKVGRKKILSTFLTPG